MLRAFREKRILVTHNSNHITTRASLIDIILVPLQCTVCAFVKWNTCPRGVKYFFIAVCVSFLLFFFFPFNAIFLIWGEKKEIHDGR